MCLRAQAVQTWLSIQCSYEYCAGLWFAWRILGNVDSVNPNLFIDTYLVSPDLPGNVFRYWEIIWVAWEHQPFLLSNALAEVPGMDVGEMLQSYLSALACLPCCRRWTSLLCLGYCLCPLCWHCTRRLHLVCIWFKKGPFGATFLK